MSLKEDLEAKLFNAVLRIQNIRTLEVLQTAEPNNCIQLWLWGVKEYFFV
jgi:hypothetical protein